MMATPPQPGFFMTFVARDELTDEPISSALVTFDDTTMIRTGYTNNSGSVTFPSGKSRQFSWLIERFGYVSDNGSANTGSGNGWTVVRHLMPTGGPIPNPPTTVAFNVRDIDTGDLMENVAVTFTTTLGTQEKLTNDGGVVSFETFGGMTFTAVFKHPDYITVTRTGETHSQQTDVVMKKGKEPGIDLGLDIKTIFDEYLTVGNILKAGAVIILVGAGSKAFKEFKETFKK